MPELDSSAPLSPHNQDILPRLRPEAARPWRTEAQRRLPFLQWLSQAFCHRDERLISMAVLFTADFLIILPLPLTRG